MELLFQSYYFVFTQKNISIEIFHCGIRLCNRKKADVLSPEIEMKKKFLYRKPPF